MTPDQSLSQQDRVFASGYETASWPRVPMPSALTAGDVEIELGKFHAKHGASPNLVCVDLSACRYIEIAALQLLISYLCSRLEDKSWKTKLRLPAGEGGVNVRHFLRRWEFDEAVKAATHVPFSRWVDPHDLRYFSGVPGGGDSGDPYAPKTVRYTDRYGEVVFGVEAYRFFRFMTWDLTKWIDKGAIVESERRRWLDADRVIIETLKRSARLRDTISPNLSTDTDKLIASRIVLQAMTNALRHPRATVLQASSHMSQVVRVMPGQEGKRRSKRRDHFFTLVYWDDGQSMYETLLNAISSGSPIRAPSEENSTYLANYHNEQDHLTDRIVVTSDLDLSPNTTKEDLFLATLFPGVSCDIRGRSKIRNTGTDHHEGILNKPGHGLFVLIEAATELMDGSVAFRTGNMFMNVKRMSSASWKRTGMSGEMPRYNVKIKRLPLSLPRFVGNLVAIRLKAGGD